MSAGTQKNILSIQNLKSFVVWQASFEMDPVCHLGRSRDRQKFLSNLCATRRVDQVITNDSDTEIYAGCARFRARTKPINQTFFLDKPANHRNPDTAREIPVPVFETRDVDTELLNPCLVVGASKI